MKRFEIAVLVVLFLLTSACQRQPKQTDIPPISVETWTVDTVHSLYRHTYVGRTEDADVVSMSFGVPGVIERVYVHNGDYVQAGQLLLSLDATKTRSLLQTAQAKLRQAQDGYQRAKQVYDQGGVTEVKMVEISTSLTEAEQLVMALMRQVADCEMRAPMAGVVGDLNSYAGQNVLPDVQLLRLHNRSGKKVSFTVPEQDVVRIRVGDSVRVTIPTLGTEEWHGRIVERNLTPTDIAHTYEVSCSLDNPAEDILPGMSCRVNCIADSICGFMVPAHCVQTYRDGLCIWLVREGQAERVTVRSSSFSRDRVLISDGLHRGDHIIVNGYQKLYNGAVVTELR